MALCGNGLLRVPKCFTVMLFTAFVANVTGAAAQQTENVDSGSDFKCDASLGQVRVLAIGNTIIDTMLTMPRVPTDDKIWVDTKKTYVGGQGANAAQAMALLGLNVSFMTRLGDDANAEMAKQAYTSLGMDLSHALVIPGALTMSATVVVATADVQRACLMHRDSKFMEFDPSSTIQGVPVKDFNIVYTDGHQLDLVLPLVHEASKQGVTVVADLEVLDDDGRVLAGLANHLIAPVSVILALAAENDLHKAMSALANQEGKVVIGTNGSYGSYGLQHGDEEFLHEPALVVDVKDTTGAGDTYHAGYVAAIAKGLKLRAAMKFATKVAAAKCETPGPVVTHDALRRFGILDVSEL